MDADLFISLITAHVIGDFYLQTNYYCEQKATLKLKSRFLYLHSLTVGLLSWLLVPTFSFWPCCLIITVSHLAIDLIKVHLPHGLGSFCLDQLAHVAVLTAIAALFRTDITLPVQWVDFPSTFSAPWLLLAILLCIKPANIFIKNRIRPGRHISEFRHRHRLRADGINANTLRPACKTDGRVVVKKRAYPYRSMSSGPSGV